MDNIKNNTENQGDDEISSNTIVFIIIFYTALWGIFSISLPDLDDFAAKYASKHDVNRSMVMHYVTPDFSFLPLPHVKYIIQYEDGTDKVIGYGFLGIVSITGTID